MKKIFSLFFAVVLLASCSSDKKGMEVSVANTNDFDRLTDLVEISLDEVKSKIKLGEGETYVVKNASGEVIPSQITYDDLLIFPAGVKANDSVKYTISAGTAQQFTPKTYGRFITERKDDFAWENDRVAFRVYGPALLPVDGPSNGIDAWYKRTSDLIIDKWYKNDLAGEASYHEDHGEGLDDYKVGRTLGAGAMAPFIDGKLVLNENFVSQELLENGPLRTTFKLTYKDLDINGKAISESRIFSLDAGSQLTKVIQEYGATEEMTVAAGLVIRNINDSVISSVDKGYIIYAEPKTPKVDGVYLGLVFPQGLDGSIINSYDIIKENDKKKVTNTFHHALGVAKYEPNTPIIYYTGYGWNQFGFPALSDFQKYIDDFSQGLKQPLVITISE